MGFGGNAEFRKIIAKNIAEQIKFSGKTQAQVSRELGINDRTVFYYTTGRALPSYETLKKLCKVLDCSYEDILGKVE